MRCAGHRPGSFCGLAGPGCHTGKGDTVHELEALPEEASHYPLGPPPPCPCPSRVFLLTDLPMQPQPSGLGKALFLESNWCPGSPWSPLTTNWKLPLYIMENKTCGLFPPLGCSAFAVREVLLVVSCVTEDVVSITLLHLVKSCLFSKRLLSLSNHLWYSFSPGPPGRD